MLKRKMLRDIMRHKSQFISIFLMAFLAVFIYSGVGGEWHGLQRSANRYYKETNLADVIIMGSGYTDEQEQAVADIDSVTATERRTIISASVKYSSNRTFKNAPELSLHFVEKNEISAFHLVDGIQLDINDEDGIWVDKRFFDANNLKIGDALTFSVMSIETEKIIRGSIYAPEYVFAGDNGGLTPNFAETGYAYLSYKAFPVSDYFAYSTIMIKSQNPEGLEAKVNEALNGRVAIYLEQKDHPSVAMFQNEINQHKMMGDIFPVVFLLVALLTMMTTMTRIVSSQRTQIGTLKSMGFKRGTILHHYVSYGFWLTLAGAVIGCIIGPLTLPLLFYPSMSGFYTMPEWKADYHISFVIVTVLVVVLCAAVTWLSCSNQLRDTPAETLCVKAPKISVSRRSFIENTALWRCFGFNTQWNLRDAARNKVRSSMAVIGVLGCTALLVCAFGINDSMELLKKWQYEDINKFESKLNLEETVSNEQIETILLAVNGEAIMESSIEIRANGIKRTAGAMIIDGGSLIQLTDGNKKPMPFPKTGVSMTIRLADILGVKTGDVVEWHIYGSENWVKTEITQLDRNPTAQGLSMSREVFEELGYGFSATSIVSAKTVKEKHDGAALVLSTEDIIAGWDDLTQAMMTMVFVLIVGAAVLSIVVLYNLGLLSFTEKERDMATLKVMGMKTKKLRGLLLTQNIWFSIVGYISGLPCGLWLIKAITDSSGETFDFPVELTLGTAVLSFAVTFGLSVFVSLLFSKKIRRLNMVESLKSME